MQTSQSFGIHFTTRPDKAKEIPVNVPLLPPALKILDKYEDNIRSLSDGRVFPTVSNQKVNSYLKEIADLCGITKKVTFHIARHTFATTVTL